MIVLKSPVSVSQSTRELLRKEIKERTGEDCIILGDGINLERIQVKKEQPLWRRLFWRG